MFPLQKQWSDLSSWLRLTPAQETAVSWILKDGMQHVVKLICLQFWVLEWTLSQKRWRILADLLYDLGSGLEVLSPLCPSLFLEVAGLGNFTKVVKQGRESAKMVRAPCCEKKGLKKGPWSGEEDQILVNYIHLHGHGNWRALPKLAGLLRCGKSCRLRWTNYLRPDIKRGNFSLQEEHTILELHNLLGNRWSTIAAKLPGRTDNEIKNVWHTHLKKRAANHDDTNNNHHQQQPTTKKRRSASKKSKAASVKADQQTKPTAAEEAEAEEELKSSSPGVAPPPASLLRQYSSDDVSSLTTGDNGGTQSNGAKPEDFSSTEEMDESFWSEVLSADSSTSTDHDFPAAELGSGLYDNPLASFVSSEGDGPKGGEEEEAAALAHSIVDYTSMDFWYNLLTGDNNKELSQLPPI